ncbi:hypothetical protein [Sediminibacillus halophilus]|uniref:2TM domain-containing protein n=1 Tax=Sediminibacillus halophilus TaxID=482461 RepID=A0A1G9RVM9_9BACI|nr:hypothetical protein [Sediminibacillus halophilus]SDM27222.1 hypothetical protein SAMN05216244_2160 [Sediminibacillus halophilus]
MNGITWMIIACEIGFWIAIVAGLVTRYLFKKEKVGLFLLAMTPVIDLILLLLTGLDLYRGAEATTAHGVAAIYIGSSIAFGKSMIEWADHRFQYYILKQGAKPPKRYSYEYARHYAKGWLRHILAFVIGTGLLAATIFVIDDAERTAALTGIIKVWALALGIDTLVAISYFIWPRPEKT